MNNIQGSDFVFKADSVIIDVIECESTTVSGKTEVVLTLDAFLTDDARDSEGNPVEVHTAVNTSSVSKWGRKLTPNDYFGMLEGILESDTD